MKRFIAVCYVLCVLQSVKSICDESVSTAGGSAFEPGKKICKGDILFEDNFDSFNLKKWQHEITLAGGGNWEFQYYLNNRSNSFVKNGELHLKPTFLADDTGNDYLYSATLDVNNGAPADVCTNPAFFGCIRTGTRTNILNPIKSARIRTVDSFYFKYGTVEVRAKMPSGDWLWPAIWMMPRFNSYGTWPASGEIDILESRGNKNLVNPEGVNVGTQQMSSTLHWGTLWSSDRYNKTQWFKQNESGFDTDFHTYKVVWGPKAIEFFVDDERLTKFVPPNGGLWELGNFNSTNFDNPWEGASTIAPFDQEFYLIINLAVGGNIFFDDKYSNLNGKPWNNTSPTIAKDFWEGRDQWEPTWNRSTDDSHLIVDYVRVYAL